MILNSGYLHGQKTKDDMDNINKFKNPLRVNLMRSVKILLLIFIIWSFTPIDTYAAETKWKINKYRIVQQAPDAKRFTNEEEVSNQAKIDRGDKKGLTIEQVLILERYLIVLGQKYQDLGFLEPEIDTLTYKNSTFEIFVYDYPDSDAGSHVARAQYGPACAGGESIKGWIYWSNDSTRYLRLDLSRAVVDEKIVNKAYEDLAHEMFHAIQQSYPLFDNDAKENNCNLGTWIAEGTAEAVGHEMARSVQGVKIANIGARNYFKPLRIGNNEEYERAKDNAYKTASLWRYIGEYISNGKKFPKTKEGKRADYRYLQELFATKIETTNEKNELDWLDDYLSTKFKVDLNRMYANFVSSFAYYMPDRISPTKQATLAKYKSRLFESCEKITLSDSVSYVENVKFKFSKVSARCLEVVYTGSSDFLTLAFDFESDRKTAESLQHIGVQQLGKNGLKTLKVKKGISGQALGNVYFGNWEFTNVPFIRQQGTGNAGRSNIFILSNIAERASNTHNISSVDFIVTIARSSGQVSTTK